jgi:ribonuclease P protein component
MFAKKFSLDRKEFPKIKNEGKLYQSESFGILVRKRENIGNPRFGIIVSNKVSKIAVHRNRIRRSFRDVLRRNWKKVEDGNDIVFLIKPGIERLPVSDIMKEIERFIDGKKYI